MIINETNAYLRNIITTINKTKPSRFCINNGILYSIIDHTQLIKIDLRNVLDQSIQIGFDNELGLINPYYIVDTGCFYDVYNTAVKYETILSSSPCIHTSSNLELDEEFSKILAMKNTDGVGRYFVDCGNKKILITVFKTMLNINKGDKIGLSVYDTGSDVYVIKFDIYKKKLKLNYDIIMRVLDTSKSII